MEVFDCPICLDNIYYDTERRMLYSQLCNHRLCDRCLETHLGQLGRNQCPQCRMPLTKADFREKEPEEALFNIEKEIRKRIINIYNNTRINYPDTPQYNDFLENREDMIYELTYGNDDIKKREIEREIKNYERNSSNLISTNIDSKAQIEKQKIKEIVQKEKTFYEGVKYNRFNELNLQLIHPLQKQFASYFKGETNYETLFSSDGFAKPLNASIKTESDIPIKMPKSKKENANSERAGGYLHSIVSQRNRSEFHICLLIQPAT